METKRKYTKKADMDKEVKKAMKDEHTFPVTMCVGKDHNLKMEFPKGKDMEVPCRVVEAMCQEAYGLGLKVGSSDFMKEVIKDCGDQVMGKHARRDKFRSASEFVMLLIPFFLLAMLFVLIVLNIVRG